VRALPLAAAAALAACAPPATLRPAVEGGEVTFAWTGEADAVFVAGTPTGWRRVPLARKGRTFTVRLPISPGRHEYRLEVEAAGAVRIVLPDGAERVDDGFGGENAVLRVGET
jgi:hypothetical protein